LRDGVIETDKRRVVEAAFSWNFIQMKNVKGKM
jgi:hypothetical protein